MLKRGLRDVSGAINLPFFFFKNLGEDYVSVHSDNSFGCIFMTHVFMYITLLN